MSSRAIMAAELASARGALSAHTAAAALSSHKAAAEPSSHTVAAALSLTKLTTTPSGVEVLPLDSGYPH